MTTQPQQVLRIAAYGVILNRAGKILLTRLSDQTRQPGAWTLPGGGVDHGEHPEAAVAREVFEETGLQVRTIEMIGIESLHLPPGIETEQDFHSVRVLYRAVADDESLPLRHEVDGTTDLACWADPAELAHLDVVELVHTALRNAAG